MGREAQPLSKAASTTCLHWSFRKHLWSDSWVVSMFAGLHMHKSQFARPQFKLIINICSLFFESNDMHRMVSGCRFTCTDFSVDAQTIHHADTVHFEVLCNYPQENVFSDKFSPWRSAGIIVFFIALLTRLHKFTPWDSKENSHCQLAVQEING